MTNEQQIWTGTSGEVWLNNTDRLLKVQKFSFTQTNQWEDVNDTDNFAKQRRLVGVELTGEITKYKTDFAFNEVMAQYKDRKQPAISLTGKVENVDTGETKRISITDVTFDGLDLIAFEKGTVNQDTLNFTAGDYEYL